MSNHQLHLVETSANLKVARNQHCLVKVMLVSFISVSMAIFVLINYAYAVEVNPYAQSYKEQNTNNLKSLDPDPDTKIYVSNHKDEDNISMLENGYDMIGSSGFSAAEASSDLALQQAKAIKADTVLVYKKYESAKTASSKSQLIKEAAKKGSEIDPNDLVEEPTQYHYYASYWAKLPTPLFGVHIIKLKKVSTEAAAEAQEERGLRIIAVIKESPASKANIFRGDTLLKVGDIELGSPDDLFAAVKRYAGQTVPVELERNGAPVRLSVLMNSRK